MNSSIQTQFVYPPIESREYDWQAILTGYEPGDPIGYGRTEQNAIDDLLNECETLEALKELK